MSAKMQDPKTFDLNWILNHSCANPVDFKAWSEHQSAESKHIRDGKGWNTFPRYRGVMVFNLQSHCTQWIIRAKLKTDDTWEILEIVAGDH